ncbi:MAG: hypothetical protein HKN17_11515 [Rhodothermales bacterium]|nr:hypothetical protein [Rhodothermales bacterium]
MSFAPKHPSGVDVVDDSWGGLYRGGSYLVYGRSASGCRLLTLAFTRTGARLGESTLFVSADRQKNLVIQAASIGFDLRRACDSGIVRLMHVPAVIDLREMEDDRVARALDDLVVLIRQNRPTRLVMNDFMPFVSFRSFNRFRHEFTEFLERIDPVDTTMMLVMPEPANDQSRRVIDFLADEMTGSIHVELPEGDPDTTRRKITLTPQVGHLRRQIVEMWDLEGLVSAAPGARESGSAAPNEKNARGAAEPTAKNAPDPEPDPEAGGPRYLTPPVGTVFREIPSELGPYDVHDAESDAGSAEDRTAEVLTAEPPPTSSASVRPERTVRRPGETAASDSHSTEQQQEAMIHPPLAAEPRYADPGTTTFAAPSGSRPTGAEPASPEAPGAPETTDREAFRIRLQQRFNTREAVGEPFLLIALRMDRSQGRTIGPFDFEFLMDLVHDAAGANDDLLVAPDAERLVILLAGARSDDAQPFFADLKERLRDTSPSRSEDLLHSVSAIVVPDGQPFRSAEEFLKYALDEDLA